MGWRLDICPPLRRVVNTQGRMGLGSSERLSRKVIVGRSVSTDPACCAEFGARSAPYETGVSRTISTGNWTSASAKTSVA